MLVIVVRCQNGVVVWARQRGAGRNAAWRCQRDGFVVDCPVRVADAEAAVVALAHHSTQLAGAILQVVELTI